MKLGGLPAISLNYRRLSSVTAPIGETQMRAGTPAISRQRERVPKALSCPTLCLPSQSELSLLRLNVTIPRHAGVDNSSFLPRSLNHPIGSARIDLHSGGCALTLTLRKRCLLLGCINRRAIGARIHRSIHVLGSASAQHNRHRYQKCPHVALPVPHSNERVPGLLVGPHAGARSQAFVLN